MEKTLIALGLAACLLGAMAACSPKNQESRDLDPSAAVRETVTAFAEENAADTAPSKPDAAETVPAGQNETDTVPAGPDAVSNASADPYQGLTQEQWQLLQDQKEIYGDLTEEELRDATFDGYFEKTVEGYPNGPLDCLQFIHLDWEHRIPMALVDYVGGSEFNTWTIERERTGPCYTIYDVAEHFSVTLDELLRLLSEQNDVFYVYDLETVKRRYEYFINASQE